jgi:hypothetical protein
MFQQILAIIIIFFFISRLYFQKKKKQISANEFIFWFLFWIFSGMAIIFLKKIDSLVAYLGFSSSGINILLYIALLIVLYMLFKMRIKIEKQERNITKIIREIALKNKE